MSERSRFFLRNLGSGILWLLVIIVVFVILFNRLGDVHYEKYIAPIYDKPFWFYLVFSLSEVAFGIIPPEIFMLVSAQKEDISFYIVTLIILSGISYGAGILGYFIGNYFNDTRFYQRLHKRYLEKYAGYVRRFGGFIIIVASLTPVPFSAIAMIIGAVDYPFRNYILFSLFRFVRFIAYSILIYQSIYFT
ncbi:MAG: VTT domain-containing protein [Bacteroidales bacterium]|nr:VTT domain-containing protein [Bacteroidales bacterium]MCF8387579.1 VTT domain-containing protein [Bacteroidales bacterium]MCF8397031.1 VTT domain-containing protein [Bacteroidales bacterium]